MIQKRPRYLVVGSFADVAKVDSAEGVDVAEKLALKKDSLQTSQGAHARIVLCLNKMQTLRFI